MRTGAPIVLAALAVVGTAAGVIGLARTFAAERAELVAAVRSERAAVEEEVTRALEGAVRAHLEVARLRVDRALDDPLVAAPDALLIEDGRVRWPQVVGAAAAPGPSLADWDRRLASAPPPGSATSTASDDDAIAERTRALSALRAAALAGDDTVITAAFRALLVARARTVLDPRVELATALASLEALSTRASPAMVRAVIEDGLSDPRHGEIEPVARTLARARALLSVDDLRVACARSAAQTTAVGLRSSALDRACAPDGEPIPAAIFATTATTTPVQVGAWWLVRDGARTVGARIDLDGELAAQSARLADRGLAGARVGFAGGRARVEAPRWAAVGDRAEAWYRRKLGLLSAAVLVAVGASAAFVALAALRDKDRRRERELVELKARFAATVSHELQTPLAAVRVMAETLERRLEGEPRARDYPQRIVAEVDRLGGLVDNILAFQRIEQGRWEVRREAVRLAELLPDLVSEAERAAGPDVVVDGAGLASAELSADPRLVRLALLNLVRNACRHNRRKPVRIGLRVRGAVLEVEDNGVGVAPEDVPRLFEEHARGRGAVGQGTGLGLALVARIARLHGGAVTLVRTSEAGSTFALSLGREGGADR